MASLSATCLTYQLPSTSKTNQCLRRSCSSLKLFSKNGFHVPRVCHLRVSCAAKPETVEKVCTIVRKQLALAPDSELTPESKFSALGADSLDTVEIIMALEEEFGIGIEEDNAQNISTVQDAADLIEDLVVNQQS